ncbi:MAG: hypothetical protein JW740_03150 [Candidatus Zambryskibacteria bacterium]|nr:hypothetical protein [Candidatus Zambryskibacteria bacterium]
MKMDKNMENENLVKIKQDAIAIQESDLKDAIQSIENENTKSSFALGFAGVLMGLIFGNIDDLLFWQKIIFSLLTIISIGFAFYNILSKKLATHTKVDEIFVNNSPNNWEKYLNYKHLRLRDCYSEAKTLLYRKTTLTKIAYFFLILDLLFLLIINLI